MPRSSTRSGLDVHPVRDYALRIIAATVLPRQALGLGVIESAMSTQPPPMA